MKKWEQRRTLLLEELAKHGRLSIGEIQTLLNISESTARRLVIELERENCLIRRFGGVQKIEPSSPKYSYEATQDRYPEEKRMIGSYAAGLIENGDVIFLSGGSTVKYMALSLAERLKNRELSDVSVITNSLVSAEALTDYTEVIMPGGIYRRSLEVLDGGLTEKNLRKMCFTKAFFGAVAIDAAEGFMTSDIATNTINEVALSRAVSFYVLADVSKFYKHSFISYAPVGAAAGIITDSMPDPPVYDSIIKQEGRMIFVNCQSQN